LLALEVELGAIRRGDAGHRFAGRLLGLLDYLADAWSARLALDNGGRRLHLGPAVGLGEPHFPKDVFRLGGEVGDPGFTVIAGENPLRAVRCNLGEKPRLRGDGVRLRKFRGSGRLGHAALPYSVARSGSGAVGPLTAPEHHLAASAVIGKAKSRRAKKKDRNKGGP
jgi:hypothetical protein